MRKKFTISILSFLLLIGVLAAEASPVSANTVTGSDIAQEARKYVGNPVNNNDGARGVSFVYGKKGISVPTTLSAISQEGKQIKKGETLNPGDILLFGTSPSNLIASGIYIGQNEFVVAYKPYGTVRKMSLNHQDAKKYYLEARRIIGSAATESQPSQPSQPSTSDIRQRVIDEGLKYLGTPYELGSSRSSTTTLDCSDFLRRTYYDATGRWLPGNGVKQANYVKQHGKIINNWRDLKKGDLMFFKSPTTGRIYHVGIYMGDGRVLHTYSIKSGGVRIDPMKGWLDRNFYYGGNILD